MVVPAPVLFYSGHVILEKPNDGSCVDRLT